MDSQVPTPQFHRRSTSSANLLPQTLRRTDTFTLQPCLHWHSRPMTSRTMRSQVWYTFSRNKITTQDSPIPVALPIQNRMPWTQGGPLSLSKRDPPKKEH